MKENEDAIDSISNNLQKNKENSNTFLKNIEKIIQTANNFKFTKKEIERLEKEFDEKPK